VLVCENAFMQSRQRVAHPPLWRQGPPLYWIPHPETIMKRDLFERFGQFDERYRIAMDGELWVRVFSKQVIVDMLSIPVVLFDQNGLSTRTDKREVAREANLIIRQNFRALVRIWARQGYQLFRAVKGKLSP